jgi:hypothetical protein
VSRVLWNHQTTYPLVPGLFPKGLRGQRDALTTHPYLIKGSRIIELYICTSRQCPVRLWSHQNYLPIGNRVLPKGIKRPTCCANYSPPPSDGVKIPRTIFLLSSSVQNALEPSELHTHWYRGSFQRNKAVNALRSIFIPT